MLLLVGSYRSEYATFSPFLRVLLQPESDGSLPRDHREVPLEPLTLDEGRELALQLIGQDDPAAVALAETIVRESGGSPYFVYELVEYLKEGGELGEGGTLSTQFSLDSVLGRRIRQAAGRGREPARGPGRRGPAAASSDRLPGRRSGRPRVFRAGAVAGPTSGPGHGVWDRSTRWRPTTTGSARRWSTISTPSGGVN